jgi:hypothetical protein
MQNISNTGLFNNQLTSKLLVLGLLIISLFGAQDNYYQVKMDIKKLIGEEVGRVKSLQE